MGRMPWLTYLWPGLPQMWREGNWSALAVSVGFAALLNLALVASLLWSELFAPRVRNLGWIAVVVMWGGSAVLSYRWDRRHPTSHCDGPTDDPFGEALNHYLKGNWFESEHVLRGLVGENPRDLDAGLMLATLLRRTGRLGEAEEQLDRLGRFEGWEKWELEISRERELLDEARTATTGESAPHRQTNTEVGKNVRAIHRPRPEGDATG